MSPGVRIGVVSTAAINSVVIPAVAASPAVSIVAIASRSEARAAEAARSLGIESWYGSYEELLADPSIEAVYVSLPNSLHLEWSMRALAAGKHVLCEKPLGRDAAAVERAFDVAERAGLVLMEGLMYRHHPQTALIQRLVREGAIGRLRLVRSTFRYRLADDERRMLRHDLDGGSLMYLGTYCVDASRLFGGEPERVCAERVESELGTDLAFHGTMRHADDVVAQFDSSFASPLAQELELVGEAGSLLATAPFRIDWPGTVELRRNGRIERLDPEPANAYRLEFENFADAVRGRGPQLLGGRDAVAQARALDLLLRSADAGGVVLAGP